MRVGDLVKFQYEGYHKSYGFGIITEVIYRSGREMTGYALFKGERLMFRSSELEVV